MEKVIKPFNPDLFAAMQEVGLDVKIYFLSEKGKKKYIKIKSKLELYRRVDLYKGEVATFYVFPSFNVLSRRYSDSIVAVLDEQGEVEDCVLKNGEFYRTPEIHGTLCMSWTPISLSVNDNLNQNTLL